MVTRIMTMQCTVASDIRLLIVEGRPGKQAVAIALATERKYAKGNRKAKLEDAYTKYIEEKA